MSVLNAWTVSLNDVPSCWRSAYASKLKCWPKKWMARYETRFPPTSFVSKICAYSYARTKSVATTSCSSFCTSMKRVSWRTTFDTSGPSMRPEWKYLPN